MKLDKAFLLTYPSREEKQASLAMHLGRLNLTGKPQFSRGVSSGDQSTQTRLSSPVMAENQFDDADEGLGTPSLDYYGTYRHGFLMSTSQQIFQKAQEAASRAFLETIQQQCQSQPKPIYQQALVLQAPVLRSPLSPINPSTSQATELCQQQQRDKAIPPRATKDISKLRRDQFRREAKSDSWMYQHHPMPSMVPKPTKSPWTYNSAVSSPGDGKREHPVKDGEIEDTDILSGRGGKTNHHEGNLEFRWLVKHYCTHYLCAPKFLKRQLCQNILDFVRDNKGRFLEKDEGDGNWYEQADERTLAKIGQLLREGKAVNTICRNFMARQCQLSSSNKSGSQAAEDLLSIATQPESATESSIRSCVLESQGTSAKPIASSLPPRKRWVALCSSAAGPC